MPFLTLRSLHPRDLLDRLQRAQQLTASRGADEARAATGRGAGRGAGRGGGRGRGRGGRGAAARRRRDGDEFGDLWSNM